MKRQMAIIMVNYGDYTIIVKRCLIVFAGNYNEPILLVAVSSEFPELGLPKNLVLHGWHTDKDYEPAIQEMKACLDYIRL